MTDTTDFPAKQVPLIELLQGVPADARLVYDDGPYSTRFIPVGRYCQEAAAALAAQPLPSTPFCLECGDGITSHDPGICGTCYAIKHQAPAAQPLTWRPIETAPDGIWLLLFGSNSHNGCAYLTGRRVGRDWVSGDDGCGLYLKPTHWMPLPPDPAGIAPPAQGEPE